MFFNRNKQVENTKEEKEDVKKVKPKMIWVDGFKGTDKDMKCGDFQYELGKEFTYDGKLDLCSSGFYACKDLYNVFNYYGLDGQNRFFKIKAFVPEDYNKNFGILGNVSVDSAGYCTENTKFVTSKIKFISECTFDDLKDYIVTVYPMIENYDEYKHIENYDIFAKNKFIYTARTPVTLVMG